VLSSYSASGMLKSELGFIQRVSAAACWECHRNWEGNTEGGKEESIFDGKERKAWMINDWGQRSKERTEQETGMACSWRSGQQKVKHRG
jgi:hypothetical protein